MAQNIYDTPQACNVEYRIADLDRLSLPSGVFDFAYSSLAFHYIEDFGKLVATIHQALTPGAQFAFTIKHPIYMAPAQPNWTTSADGRKSWPLDGYAVEGARQTDWLAKGVLKYHRTVGTTLNALIDAGFNIRHVQEWAPTAEQIASNPGLAEELDRPMMLLVAAGKS